MENVQTDDEVAAAILAYLDDHPQAQDTLKGIAEWWLMRQRIRVNVAQVSRVVQRLTERGLLEAIGTGEHRRYRKRA